MSRVFTTRGSGNEGIFSTLTTEPLDSELETYVGDESLLESERNTKRTPHHRRAIPSIHRHAFVFGFRLPAGVARFLPSLSYRAALPIRTPRSNQKQASTLLLNLAVALLTMPLFFGFLVVMYGGIPPSYGDVRQRERKLSQHLWSRSAGNWHPRINIHDGSEVQDDGEMYLRFPDHLWGHGLNNVLQEALLYALLAHHSNRSFVFEDFVWSHLPLPYTLYDFTLRPTRIPMGAFLGGWIVGDTSAVGDSDGIKGRAGGSILGIEHQVFVDKDDGERVAESEGEAEESWRRSGPAAHCGNIHFSPQSTLSALPALTRAQSKDLRRRTRNAPFVDSVDVLSPARSRSGPSLASSSGKLNRPNLPPKGKSTKETRTTPRHSVSGEYFEHVCPPSRRVEIAYTWPSSSEVASGSTKSGSEDKSDKGVTIFSTSAAAEDLVDRGNKFPPAATTIGASSLEAGGYSSSFPPPLVLPAPSATADGVQILQWWVERLGREDVKGKKCVVVREVERRIWDSEFFGSPRILSLFPLLRNSPILRAFQWSPLVKGAVERSVARLFQPPTPEGQPPPKVVPKSFSTPANPAHDEPEFTVTNSTDEMDIIPGVLAVHLRRGDYKRHCVRLSKWGAGYMGWNRLVHGVEDGRGFEAGLEAFLAKDLAGANLNQGLLQADAKRDGEYRMFSDFRLAEFHLDASTDKQERKEAYYLAHCLPTIPQIVSRLRQVRATYGLTSSPSASGGASVPCPPTSEKKKHTLSQVYVLTNGWPSFVAELRTALLDDGWERVIASIDLENDDVDAFIPELVGPAPASAQTKSVGLHREEKGVSAAIDMGLAERAEVFVGNGFSSLSANVVMLRIAKGFPIHSNRLL